jgi:hypothetical protein
MPDLSSDLATWVAAEDRSPARWAPQADAPTKDINAKGHRQPTQTPRSAGTFPALTAAFSAS